MSSSRESSATSAPRIMCMSSAMSTLITSRFRNLDQELEPAVAGACGGDATRERSCSGGQASEPTAVRCRFIPRRRYSVIQDLQLHPALVMLTHNRTDAGLRVAQHVRDPFTYGPGEHLLHRVGQLPQAEVDVRVDAGGVKQGCRPVGFSA